MTTQNDTEKLYDATFRLMQDSGVPGPTKTTKVESVHHAEELAFAWSEGELGHPWDVCVVEIPELDAVVEMRQPSTIDDACDELRERIARTGRIDRA